MQEKIQLDKLIGSLDENFYQLGLKDKIAFHELYSHLTNLSKLDMISQVLPNIVSLFEKKIVGHEKYFNQIIQNYAQGVDAPPSKILSLLLVPELISSQQKWNPELLSLLPGCSSLFIYNQKTESTVHGRILDFPLANQFEKYERTIYIDVEGLPKIITHSTRGHALAALTSMNEAGLTLAIHQKFSNYFDAQGEPICKIAFDIISQCENVHEVKKFIKQKKSMTYWGMYLSDKNNEVLALDICGDHQYFEKYEMKESKVLYFNNLPIILDDTTKHCGPKCYQDLCLMKHKTFEQNLEKITQKKFKNDHEKALYLLTNLEPKIEEHALNYKLSPLNLASIQVTTFNNQDFSSNRVSGRQPKNLENEIIEFKNIFTNIKTSITKYDSNSLPTNYRQALERLSLAQSLYDNKQIEEAYHELQMSILAMKNYEESYIYQFFFVVWQYLDAQTNDDFKSVYSQLILLEKLLPEFLMDHYWIFKQRIEKICDMPIADKTLLIKNEALKSIYEKEKKLRSMAIKVLRNLTYPRLELPDIIYFY